MDIEKETELTDVEDMQFDPNDLSENTEFEVILKPEFTDAKGPTLKEWASNLISADNAKLCVETDHSLKTVEILNHSNYYIGNQDGDLRGEVERFMSSNQSLNNKFLSKLQILISKDYKNGTLEKSVLSLCESTFADEFDALLNSVIALPVFEKCAEQKMIKINSKLGSNNIMENLENVELELNCICVVLSLHLNENAQRSILESWLSKILGDIRIHYEWTLLAYKEYCAGEGASPDMNDENVASSIVRIRCCFDKVLQEIYSLLQILVFGEQQVIAIVYLCNLVLLQIDEKDALAQRIRTKATELLTSVPQPNIAFLKISIS